MYRLDSLTPYDFEDLARDIAQDILGVRVETFTVGRDGGIDFRYGDGKNGIIIQSKHVGRFANLKQQLKKEAEKILRLEPERYILITSTPLTPPNKSEVQKMFGAKILANSDILSASDVQNILERNAGMVKQHYKLWFLSVPILQQILNNAPEERSHAKRKEMLDSLKYYVQTGNINSAIEILNNKNFLIISGIPGIGKTTLADMVALRYLEEDYELIYIQSVEEAERLIRPELKQLFYFDDFLGRNNLKKDIAADESKLAFLLKRVAESKNKKLIMTTREYILRQAKMITEALSKKDVEYSTCVLKLEDYSRYQKANILYNHVYFSQFLSKRDVESLKRNDHYLKIIDHHNYNPRLIGLITGTDEFSVDADADFFEHLVHILDNPKRIWQQGFSNAKPACKYLLYCLLAAPDEVPLDELKSQYEAIVEYSDRHQVSSIKKDEFLSALKELDNSFLKTGQNFLKENTVSFHNPSVRDYLLNYVETDQDLIPCLFSTAARLGPLLNLFTLRTRKTRIERMIFGSVSGEEHIYIRPDLHHSIAEIIMERFFEYLDTSVGNQNALIRTYSLFADFWGTKMPKELRSFLRSLVKRVMLKELTDKRYIEYYLNVLKKLRIPSEKIIRELIAYTLHGIEDDMAMIDAALAFAVLYDNFRLEVEEESELLGLNYLDRIDQIVREESDGFDYDYDESRLEEVLESIQELEMTFGRDYERERSAVESARWREIEPDELGPRSVEDIPKEDSDAAIKQLFSTL